MPSNAATRIANDGLFCESQRSMNEARSFRIKGGYPVAAKYLRGLQSADDKRVSERLSQVSGRIWDDWR